MCPSGGDGKDEIRGAITTTSLFKVRRAASAELPDYAWQHVCMFGGFIVRRDKPNVQAISGK